MKLQEKRSESRNNSEFFHDGLLQTPQNTKNAAYRNIAQKKLEVIEVVIY